MELKTNYRDALWDGNRLYQVTDVGGGKSTIKDVTEYTQEGDSFGAKDINDTNKEVNRINHTINLPISMTSWRGSSAPYIFALTMVGVTSEDVPIIGLSISGEANAETVKAQNKAWSCVDRVVTSTDKITFYCYRKKPEADLTVTIKGV